LISQYCYYQYLYPKYNNKADVKKQFQKPITGVLPPAHNTNTDYTDSSSRASSMQNIAKAFKSHQETTSLNYSTTEGNSKLYCTILLVVCGLGRLTFFGFNSLIDSQKLHSTGRTLLDNGGHHQDLEYWIGYGIGWGSAACYLGSRLPQIYKNFTRKSTEGLSPVMFTMAVMGNITYALGIFLYSVEKDYIMQRIPWILGSVGTLCFDATTLTQFVLYRPKKNKQVQGKLFTTLFDDDDAKSPLLPQQQSYESRRQQSNYRRTFYYRIGIGWHPDMSAFEQQELPPT